MDFYNRLNYSLGNEDWNVEEQALCIKPNDYIICVTASGDRPLHLLLTDCAKVFSIDMNAIQTYLLELKMAAIALLDYEAYLAFLGCTESRHRENTFQQLKPHLSTNARNHWERHKKMIKKGILYQGRVERLTKVASKLFKIVRFQKIKTLLSFDDIALQQDYVGTAWDTKAFRKFFEFILNPNMMKFILNDPGIISYIDDSIHPGHYIYQRMLNYLNNHLAKKSALIQLVLTGKIQKNAYLPYLTFEGYQKIRVNLHKLQFQTSNIIDFLNHTEPAQFDAFSMSDIASYMSQQNFNQLLIGIYKTAKPSARFCVRKLMSNHITPDELLEHFERDTQLEHKLENEESNFVYRFMVGNVRKRE